MTKTLARRRSCPRCQCLTGSTWCCGIDLTVRRAPWVMTIERIRLIHILKARKGLTDEVYRLRLGAVGVDSCKQLGRQQFRIFLAGLVDLPDVPNWLARKPRPAAAQRARTAP